LEHFTSRILAPASVVKLYQHILNECGGIRFWLRDESGNSAAQLKCQKVLELQIAETGNAALCLATVGLTVNRILV
jgi:hypothetical protein